MSGVVDAVLVLLILSGFSLLSFSRLSACIRAVAIQGLLLGVLAVAVQDGSVTAASVLPPLISALVKGFVLPWMLFRAMREAQTAREVEPLISYNLSIMAGAAALGVSLWLGERLKPPSEPASSLLMPAAFFISLAGLIVIITRRKALTQVLGYLALENGVYAFGAAVALQLPVLLELGVLLDVFVGVFVMGIAIFHIGREFDHIDTDKLASLTDRVQ